MPNSLFFSSFHFCSLSDNPSRLTHAPFWAFSICGLYPSDNASTLPAEAEEKEHSDDTQKSQAIVPIPLSTTAHLEVDFAPHGPSAKDRSPMPLKRPPLCVPFHYLP
ncbi:hypothetical protein MPH_04085 [Macrophomina phaseolina MS6]|uniref:Uncharacterized protein n=1 Tax=Macrophomina phaseolina (strain MS6) TaxID=1126212 RepID=K2SPH4_MACPH|nr:hypothetical protein MPH_04085 [Macrophomina phaseolina MS6]